MEGNALQDLVRNILGLFDSVIYGFINTVYNTFVNISSYTLINNEVMETFTQRIYILIGVFMLFKLTFSLITYFINPDSLSEQKSGFGNLIQRVVISLVLLVLTPTLFNLAFKAQTIILKENILANLVLGGEYSSISTEAREEMYANAGRKMAFTTLSAFFHPEDEDVLNMSDEELSEKYKDDQDALKYLKEYRKAVEESDIDALVGWYKLNTKEDKDGKYLFVYSVLLSPIAGIMILWVLVIFCIDIGVRSVKLAFLQLISPIPILSYIDVKKGEGVFKKWIGDCFSTYLEVFVKLLSIYFVIFIITLICENGFFEYVIDSNNNITTQKIENVDLFAKAFIIIGLLIFANEVPKLIGDMFGIKTDGFSLNPMKKIGASPLASGLIGGITGGLVGAGLTAYGNYKTHRQMNDGVKTSLKSGFGGIFSGIGHGAVGGLTQKKFGDMIGSGTKASSSSANKIMERPNTTMWGRNLAKFQSKVGLRSAGELYEKQLESYRNIDKHTSTISDAAKKRLDKKPNKNVRFNYTDINGNTRLEDVNIAEQRARVEALSHVDVGGMSNSQKEAHIKELANAKSLLAQAEKEAVKGITEEMRRDYVTGNLSSLEDPGVVDAFDNIQEELNAEPTWYQNLQYKDDNGNIQTYTPNINDVDFFKQTSSAVGQAAAQISTSDEYKVATANRDYAKNTSGNSKK